MEVLNVDLKFTDVCISHESSGITKVFIGHRYEDNYIKFKLNDCNTLGGLKNIAGKNVRLILEVS